VASKKAAKAADPIHLDQTTTRGDGEVLHGGLCRIEKGEHAGKTGVFVSTVAADKDGYPDVVQVKLRSTGQLAIVDYADITPAAHSGQ
jgi:hypothetical protein